MHRFNTDLQCSKYLLSEEISCLIRVITSLKLQLEQKTMYVTVAFRSNSCFSSDHWLFWQIYNSTQPSSDHHITSLSGEHPDWSVNSTTGQFLLKFTTDKRINYKGWTASFSFGKPDSSNLKINLELNLSRDMTKPTKWVCTQRRLRSAWASAQSDQSLHCALSE